MTTLKNLGIWMDHSSAHLMDCTADPIETRIIESNFTYKEKEETLNKSENLMHNKENHRHAEYYKKIADEIRNYDHVLLFGPTEAKLELSNILKADHNFAKIEIEVKPADKMSEHQQHAFVRDYFSKN